MTTDIVPEIHLSEDEINQILKSYGSFRSPDEEENRERATDIYLYRFRDYGEHTKRIRHELEMAMIDTNDISGDKSSNVDIRIQPLEDYLYNADSYGPKFAAWSEKYVYFRCTYDGHYWVSYMTRNPSDELSKTHGGG